MSTAAASETSVQVLEFALGEDVYCVDIQYIAEIANVGEMTTVPNAPPAVRGIMDLRGHTTSVVDPKRVFGIDGAADGRRILVFDPTATDDQEAVGWLVDEVHRVAAIEPDETEVPTAMDDAVVGIVRRDDDFVIWVDPERVTE